MANLSDASVEIEVEKVGKELVEYIAVTNKSMTDYVITYETPSETEVDENGNILIIGGASGRWSYENNLEGYFDDGHVKSWLGVDADYSWMKDESEKRQYRETSAEQYEAYQKLVEAIKAKNGRITINYTDADPAMCWMGNGKATVEVIGERVRFTNSFQSENLDITKYAKLNDMSISEAFDTLHGEEVGTAWLEYVDKCKVEKKEPKDPQVWFDEDFEWE